MPVSRVDKAVPNVSNWMDGDRDLLRLQSSPARSLRIAGKSGACFQRRTITVNLLQARIYTSWCTINRNSGICFAKGTAAKYACGPCQDVPACAERTGFYLCTTLYPLKRRDL